jgi:hypothetical protein
VKPAIPLQNKLLARMLNGIHPAGVVNYATEDSSYNKALSLAESMLPQGPIAIRMAKMAIDKGLQADM